uniref:S100/CaBP-9k-type calcium binding subdomain domain-containing protein n=1 Tax=Seriola lalandi dorsalis TaxID=1841481 RepID=A0A3B4X941_SERLL
IRDTQLNLQKWILLCHNFLKTRTSFSSSSCCAVVFPQGIGTDQGLGEIMRKMGVGDGEGISFKHFWNLIQSVATSQHSLLSSNKGSSCNCILL